jgi:protein TonB
MRYLIALVLAISVTFLLLWGMQTLISGGNDALTDAPKGRVLDFIRLQPEDSVVKKDRKPKKPPQPKTPPPQPQPQQIAKTDPNAKAISSSFSADIQTDMSLGKGLSLDRGDGEYLPIVKVAPIYPRRAQSRGIEGFVIVEFVVTTNGSVKTPVVVRAEPQSIFDQAAIDAVLKFKYKPRMVDGVAQEVAGVQNKITFAIDG